MSAIYKITNKINGKAYIGKTLKSNPIDRFKTHIKDSKIEGRKNRALYRAFNKYGIENFNFEVIEEVNDYTKLSEREIYYINKYDTYKNGYNETLGGDGTSKIDRDAVIDKYLKTFNIKEIALEFDVCESSIRDIIRERGYKFFNLHKLSIPIVMMDPKTGMVCIYTSAVSAAKVIYTSNTGEMDYIIDGKLNLSISGIASHLRRAVKTGGNSYDHIWFRISREDYCKMLKSYILGDNNIEIKNIYKEQLLIAKAIYANMYISKQGE